MRKKAVKESAKKHGAINIDINCHFYLFFGKNSSFSRKEFAAVS